MENANPVGRHSLPPGAGLILTTKKMFKNQDIELLIADITYCTSIIFAFQYLLNFPSKQEVRLGTAGGVYNSYYAGCWDTTAQGKSNVFIR